jgi:hypothetical protein
VSELCLGHDVNVLWTPFRSLSLRPILSSSFVQESV